MIRLRWRNRGILKVDSTMSEPLLNIPERMNAAVDLVDANVDAGRGDMLQIVCGAPNVYVGMKAPVALVGARLPGGLEIRKTKLRGVESQGMLCSEKELGLGEGADGLMALTTDAQVGVDFREWLDLDDVSIDIDLTPNRGDCFSVLGVARETAVLTHLDLASPEVEPVPPATELTKITSRPTPFSDGSPTCLIAAGSLL